MLRLLSSNNHPNPVMLVFIGKLSLSAVRWVTCYRTSNYSWFSFLLSIIPINYTTHHTFKNNAWNNKNILCNEKTVWSLQNENFLIKPLIETLILVYRLITSIKVTFYFMYETNYHINLRTIVYCMFIDQYEWCLISPAALVLKEELRRRMGASLTKSLEESQESQHTRSAKTGSTRSGVRRRRRYTYIHIHTTTTTTTTTRSAKTGSTRSGVRRRRRYTYTHTYYYHYHYHHHHQVCQDRQHQVWC